MSKPKILELQGETLFENESGLNDNITLSKSIEEFEKIKISYFISLAGYTVKKEIETDAKTGESFTITEVLPHSDILMIINSGQFKFTTATQISKTRELDARFQAGNTVLFQGVASRIQITKIIGY